MRNVVGGRHVELDRSENAALSFPLEVARDILKANSTIDDLHLSVFKAIASPDWAESPATTVDVALASRYFERFADHGVSVARKVTYLVTGEWQPQGL